MFRRFALAAVVLACAAFARPPKPLTQDQAKAWLEVNAPGWVILRSDASGLIMSAKIGSVDDSAYPIIHYTSRADLAEGVISTMIQFIEVDCAARRYRSVGGTAADETGVTVDIPPDTQWDTAPAGSVSGILHTSLCDAGKKKHR